VNKVFISLTHCVVAVSVVVVVVVVIVVVIVVVLHIGTSLLIHTATEQSSASYYGEQGLHYVDVKGESCLVPRGMLSAISASCWSWGCQIGPIHFLARWRKKQLTRFQFGS